MTAPITASLMRPLAKLASAWLENSRFNPASGEILRSFGFSGSADHTRRCWITLPASAASTSSGERQSERREHLAFDRPAIEMSSAGPSTGIWCELAIRPRNVVVRPPLIEPENAGSISVAAADHEPGRDLLALDDVAALERLVEPLLCRVFCAI